MNRSSAPKRRVAGAKPRRHSPPHNPVDRRHEPACWETLNPVRHEEALVKDKGHSRLSGS